MTAPSESTVYWYKNNNLIHASVTRDLTLSSPYHENNNNPVLGINEQRHRLCIDPWVNYDMQPVEFKCRVQSSCNSKKVIESQPLIIEPSLKLGNFHLIKL